VKASSLAEIQSNVFEQSDLTALMQL